MRAGGGIGGELGIADALLANLRTQRVLAGAKQGDEIGHRGAGKQHAAGAGRHAHHLRRPGDHLALDGDAGMVAAAAIGVHRAGQ